MAQFTRDFQAVQPITKQIIAYCNEMLANSQSLNEEQIDLINYMVTSAQRIDKTVTVVVNDIAEKTSKGVEIPLNKHIHQLSSFAITIENYSMVLTVDLMGELSPENQKLCTNIMSLSQNIYHQLIDILVHSRNQLET